MNQQKQSKKKGSVNWINLLLWALVIASFIIAIVAVSKKSPAPIMEMDDGTQKNISDLEKQTSEDNIQQIVRDTLSSGKGIDTIKFSNGVKFVTVGGDSAGVNLQGQNAQVNFSLNGNGVHDIVQIKNNMKSTGNVGKYWYYNWKNIFPK
jgi:hypothetical protein